MTDSTPGREQDRQLLAAAPESSDDWDDATWAAWARTADRAHADRASAVRADRDAAVAAAASHTLAKMTELRDRLKAMKDPARSGVSLAIHLVRALTDEPAETPARAQGQESCRCGHLKAHHMGDENERGCYFCWDQPGNSGWRHLYVPTGEQGEDAICGNQFDDMFCDRDPGHDGHHGYDTTAWDSTEAPAREQGETCTSEYGGPGYTHCELSHGHPGQHESAMGNMRRAMWGQGQPSA